MKQSNIYKSILIKASLFFTFTVVCLALIPKCDAQSIIGKWKIISTSVYFTPEGATKQGQPSRENLSTSTTTLISEFRSDHTYVKTSSEQNGTNKITLDGTWILNGDQLTITIDPKKYPNRGDQTSTQSISITGNSLKVTHVEANNKMISKIVTNFQKI